MRGPGRNLAAKGFWQTPLTYIALILVAIIVLFPIYWMLISSLKFTPELFVKPPTWVPRKPTLSNFNAIFKNPLFLRYLLNSVIVALMTTAVSIVIAALAGYGWGKMKFPGREATLIFVLVSQLLPVVALVIPLFQILKRLLILNTYPGLTVAYLVYTIPLSSWLLKGFFQELPEEILDSAKVDGCSHFLAFFRIALPLVRPAIAATAIYCFIMSWQEFFFALSFMFDDEMKTLTVGILGFMGQYKVSWNELMAGSFVSVLPTAIAFLFVQKHFVAGLTKGAIK
jgi:multiple sugar transport system permease protein